MEASVYNSTKKPSKPSLRKTHFSLGIAQGGFTKIQTTCFGSFVPSSIPHVNTKPRASSLFTLSAAPHKSSDFPASHQNSSPYSRSPRVKIVDLSLSAQPNLLKQLQFLPLSTVNKPENPLHLPAAKNPGYKNRIQGSNRSLNIAEGGGKPKMLERIEKVPLSSNGVGAFIQDNIPVKVVEGPKQRTRPSLHFKIPELKKERISLQGDDCGLCINASSSKTLFSPTQSKDQLDTLRSLQISAKPDTQEFHRSALRKNSAEASRLENFLKPKNIIYTEDRKKQSYSRSTYKYRSQSVNEPLRTKVEEPVLDTNIIGNSSSTPVNLSNSERLGGYRPDTQNHNTVVGHQYLMSNSVPANDLSHKNQFSVDRSRGKVKEEMIVSHWATGYQQEPIGITPRTVRNKSDKTRIQKKQSFGYENLSSWSHSINDSVQWGHSQWNPTGKFGLD